MGARSRVFGVTAAAVLAWSSTAFACSAQPQVRYSLLPEASAPGATVLVEGEYVRSRQPVEIRWNGVAGPLLAIAKPERGALAVQVKVPEVAPGIYSLMLVSKDAGVGRTPFEVTGSAEDAPAALSATKLWPGAADAPALAAEVPVASSMIGVALLAVGLSGLFGAATVAVAHRRRVLA